MNGAQVNSHHQMVIKMLISQGVSEDEAHKRITGKGKPKQDDVPGWITSIESTYINCLKYKSNGMNGPNPLTMMDIKGFEQDVGRLTWWEKDWLIMIDDLVMSSDN